MRLIIFLTVVACTQAAAGGYAQKVSLSEQNVPLSLIFKEIKKQTGYNFLYNYDWLKEAKNVSINVKQATLTEALDICFKDQPFTYEILENTITLKRKAEIGVAPIPIPSLGPVDIHGRVTDSLGNPLSGASVYIKGTKKGVQTRQDGTFDIKSVDSTVKLQISFTGYLSREIDINKRNLLSIVLSASDNPLDAVQIIAYGTTSRRISTGNVTTITSGEIEEQPVANPLLALEGRVPGLSIIQNTGVANGEVIARIQGQNSISSGNDPLIVVDGVPIPATLTETGVDGPIRGAANTGGTPLSFINPSDIESMEVLKDADATAIYGTRAANGAILITTKKGKVGKSRVDLNIQQGWGHVTRKAKMLNTGQYLDMRKEAFRNDGIDWTGPSVSANDLKVYDTTRYTDWQKKLIGGISQYTNANLSVSGGTLAVQYLIGGTYHRETTVFPGNLSDQKGSIHFNLISVSENQKFKTQFSGNYLVDDNHLPVVDLTSSALWMEPDAPQLFNKDGSLNWEPDSTGTSTINNPLAYTFQTYNNTTKNLISNLLLAYTILPGLDLRSSFGYTDMRTDIFAPVPLASIRPDRQATTPRTASYVNRTLDTWIIEPQLTYKMSIGNGKLDAVLGTTIEQDNTNTQNLYGSGYNSDLVLNDVGSAASITATSAVLQYKYNALFGRLNYNWLDKYIINLTARRDGSSHFGDANKFHDFESIGGAWIFSQTGFVKSNIALISFGKLKASYGTTGNDQIGDYARLSSYNNNYVSVPYQGTVGLVPSNLYNPYVQWELTKKFQSGLDLGFLQDRILIDVTYSRNRSSNQLLSYALPSTTGFSSIINNFPATVQNTDWEISISTMNVKGKKFTWKSSLNLTIPRNKVISFPNFNESNYADSSEGVIVGQPIGTLKLYHSLGVDPATGLYQVADLHGNPTDNPDYTTDRTKLITPSQRFYGGFINSLTYRRVQLDFLFSFVRQLGTKDLVYFNGNGLVPGQFFKGNSNQPVTVLDRWQQPGDVKPIGRFNTDGTVLVWPQPTVSDGGYSYNASYIRLKNVALSWLLPVAWLKKGHFQNGSIYVQAQNLLTFTKYSGLDPENQSTSALPPLRVISVGIKLGF